MSLERAQPGGRPYFAALDGFRGLLAVCVAIYHTYWLSNVNSSAFFEHGPVLIDLFFVFSGFLMFTLYGGMRTAEEGAEFLKRRVARLYPVHFVMTLALLAFAFFRIAAHSVGLSTLEVGEVLPFAPGAAESGYSLLTNLLLAQSMGLHDNLTFNAPAWTVSVEMFAYFTFILMMLRCPPTRAWHFGMIALGVAATYLWLSRLRPDMDITHDLGFFRCLAGFYTGLLCAWILPWWKRASSRAGTALATSVELAVVSGFAGFVIYFPGKWQFFIGAVAAVFVLVFALDRGLVSRVLTLAPFRYLARISYSLYMVHFLFALGFGMVANIVLPGLLGPDWNPDGMAGDLLLLPYLVSVVFGAHILHTMVEEPGARWMKSVLGAGRSRALPQR